MGKKSIEYAENTLGVHQVHDEAQRWLMELDSTMNQLAGCRADRRALEEAIVDLEVDIQIDETSKHPTMSATALKEHVKLAIRKHAAHSEIRRKLRETQNQVDRLEIERSRIESHLKVATARLGELGGYLQYLAEVKRSITAGTTSAPPTSPETPEGEHA